MREKTDSFGLYLHFPFCVQKCAYCDFLSAPADENTKRAYADALIAEIKATGENEGRLPVDTLYLGGGTPSVMAPEDLMRVMEALQTAFAILPEAEIRMEIKPGTVTDALLAFVARHINRVSVGVQSMDDAALQALGRIHSAAEAGDAILALQAIGIKNLSADLMLGLPGQAVQSLQKSVAALLALSPQHISLYGLQVEAGTRFFELQKAGRLPLPDEDALQTMEETARQMLQAQGYARYEISNYAKEGHASAHNLRYWQCRPYLGFGIGAASYDGVRRYTNTRALPRYLQESKTPERLRDEVHPVSKAEAMEEYCFLGLRMRDGIAVSSFAARFSEDLTQLFGEAIEKHAAAGLLDFDGEHLRLTARGMDVSNVVLADFLLPATEHGKSENG